MRRKISLMIMALLATSNALFLAGCSRPAEPEMDASISFDINDPKIRERLGQDDGYAFALLYGGDIHGSLETCG